MPMVLMSDGRICGFLLVVLPTEQRTIRKGQRRCCWWVGKTEIISSILSDGLSSPWQQQQQRGKDAAGYEGTAAGGAGWKVSAAVACALAMVANADIFRI